MTVSLSTVTKVADIDSGELCLEKGAGCWGTPHLPFNVVMNLKSPKKQSLLKREPTMRCPGVQNVRLMCKCCSSEIVAVTN